MIPFIRSTILVLFFALSLSLLAEDEEALKPEYKELLDIVESQKTLIERLKDDVPEKKLEAELELRIETIIASYEQYIATYPRNVFGKILYGKFLRMANKPDEANEVFLEIHEDNPEIAVVNQHLALYASEQGDFENAYKFFQSAIALEPDAALFHYQFGEFLDTFRSSLVSLQLLTLSEAETKMQLSFEKAHRLAPENRDFHMRWAESYFNVFNPDWEEVLVIWNDLLMTSTNVFERDVMNLQKARVLIHLSRFYEARELIEGVNDPALRDSKRKLLDSFPDDLK
jgi:tetratricopeptide (TPR) repeat protein